MCVRAIVNENGGVARHGKTHRIPLQHLLKWLLALRLYGCNLFTARDLVCDLSFAIEMYNKKQEKPEQRDHKKNAQQKEGQAMAEGNKKLLNSEMPRDLKTPYTLQPILPAVCEKKCFLLLSFLSQRKTTLSHRYFSLWLKTGSVTLTSLKPNLSICSLASIIFARAFGNGCSKIWFTTVTRMTFSVLQPSGSVVVTLQAGLIIPRDNWACLMLSQGLANTDFYLFILK